MTKKIILFFALISINIFSQDIETEINGFVKPYIDEGKNTGIMVGVFEAGSNTPRIFSYGRVRKEDSLKPDENTVFEIGGVTGTFTATMLVMLEREGRLRINDYAQNYIPDSITFHKFDAEQVKLLNLVTHTSSMPKLPSNLTNSHNNNPNDPYKNYNANDLYTYINNYILDWEPGTMYIFSYTGMGLLGHIISMTDSLSYETSLHKYIIDSLQMTRTGIRLTSDMAGKLAQGYNINGAPVGLWNFDVLQGAGAIRSSLGDMMKYLAFHLGKNKIMHFEEGLMLMQKPRFETNDAYIFTGAGWLIKQNEKGSHFIWCAGETGSYSAYIGFIPETGAGTVILSNSANSVDNLGTDIIKLLNR